MFPSSPVLFWSCLPLVLSHLLLIVGMPSLLAPAFAHYVACMFLSDVVLRQLVSDSRALKFFLPFAPRSAMASHAAAKSSVSWQTYVSRPRAKTPGALPGAPPQPRGPKCLLECGLHFGRSTTEEPISGVPMGKVWVKRYAHTRRSKLTCFGYIWVSQRKLNS